MLGWRLNHVSEGDPGVCMWIIYWVLYFHDIIAGLMRETIRKSGKTYGVGHKWLRRTQLDLMAGRHAIQS